MLTDLGRAKRIVVDKDNTTLIDGAGDEEAIKGRIKEIEVAIDKTTSDYDQARSCRSGRRSSPAVWR